MIIERKDSTKFSQKIASQKYLKSKYHHKTIRNVGEGDPPPPPLEKNKCCGKIIKEATYSISFMMKTDYFFCYFDACQKLMVFKSIKKCKTSVFICHLITTSQLVMLF